MTALAVSLIRLDGGTQPRATIHKDWIEEYAADMATGAAFPPVVVFFDGSDYWLADGYHRTGAAQALGLETIDADVRQGTQRDAILFSVSANSNHGQRRTNEDKRRAVLRLIHDPEWSGWSDREIARRCGVTHPFVANLRPPPPKAAEVPRVSGNDYQMPSAESPQPRPAPAPQPRTVQRGGTTYQQNTANIGRTPAPPPPRPVTPIQPAPRLEIVEEPEPEAPPPVVIRFDHDAAATREKAMNAIAALAGQPAPEAVIEAWMKHTGYGVEVATIESAIAWLTAFLPLYAEAEPKRWATIQEKIRNVA